MSSGPASRPVSAHVTVAVAGVGAGGLLAAPHTWRALSAGGDPPWKRARPRGRLAVFQRGTSREFGGRRLAGMHFAVQALLNG